MAESLLQKAQRLGIKPASSSESLIEKAQRLGITPQAGPKTDALNGFAQIDKGYLERVGGAYQTAATNIVGAITRPAELAAQGASPWEVAGNVARAGLRTVGNVAGAAFAPITEAIAPAVAPVVGKIASLPGVENVVKWATEQAQAHPELAKDLEAVINLGGLGLGKAGVKAGEEVVANLSPKFSAWRAANRTKSALKVEKELNDLAGKIVQGKPDDIQAARKTLANLDIENVDSYSDLKTVLNDKVDDLSSGLDKILETKKGTKRLDELNAVVKIGEETLEHNYVDDAITQLEKYYQATNDVANLGKVQQLKAKAQQTGLTVKEINDLARQHGKDLNAYNANGELASGLSKQSAENTRKGLKNTARALFNDPDYKAIDQEISNVIRVRDLAADMEVKANTLRQKIMERNLGAKIGYYAMQAINTLSGNTLKGAAEFLIPRGRGYKVLNALDLEQSLQKNLKMLQKLEGAKSDTELIKGIQDWLKETQENASANSRGGFLAVGGSQADDTLLQEARMIEMAKKSPHRASDFISDMSGQRFFHGSAEDFDVFDISKVGKTHKSDWGNGISLAKYEDLAHAYKRSAIQGTDSKGVVKEFYIDPKAKIYEYHKTSPRDISPKLGDELAKDGYDALYIYDELGRVEEALVMNPKVIYTPSQLTDIWKKANQAPQKVGGAKTFYRGGPPSEMPKGTAQDVINYEINELGNSGVKPVPGIDLSKIDAKNLQWLTEKAGDAREYGELSKEVLDEGSYRIIATDPYGGVLVERIRKSSVQAPQKVTKVPTAKELGLSDKSYRVLSALMSAAPEAKVYVDDIADQVAKEVGGKVAKAPMKSWERAAEKVKNKYNGDISRLGDLARNTVVVPKSDLFSKTLELVKAKAKVAAYEVKSANTDPFGYSGVNVDVIAPNGLRAEMQINTPAMIYAKHPKADALAILGPEEFQRLDKKFGGRGGLGHTFYEKAQYLSPFDEKAIATRNESRQYYSEFIE